MPTDIYAKLLINSGAILFLINLVQGAFVKYFHNPRMALSAHLTAAQCGMALMIFGLLRPFLLLDTFSLQIFVWSSIGGFYLLWLGISLAALSGASKTLPLAGAGYSASRYSETTVAIAMGAGSILSFVSSGYLIAGLWQ